MREFPIVGQHVVVLVRKGGGNVFLREVPWRLSEGECPHSESLLANPGFGLRLSIGCVSECTDRQEVYIGDRLAFQLTKRARLKVSVTDVVKVSEQAQVCRMFRDTKSS